MFLIAICRPTGDKWQSKTLFLSIFDPLFRLLIAFSIAAYPVWEDMYKSMKITQLQRVKDLIEEIGIRILRYFILEWQY